MKINGKEYKVVEKFFRTKGSRNQRLTKDKMPDVESRRAFYVVSDNNDTFWVKEYVDKNYGHSIKYEFEETKRLGKPYIMQGHHISTVKILELDDNKILMEHLKEYKKINKTKITDREKTIIRRLIKAWIDTHKVHDYDMCHNNTMINIKNGIVNIKLIDFEYSKGQNKVAWEAFIRSIK